jgi:hypothetical protein
MFDPFLSDYRPHDNSGVSIHGEGDFGDIGGQKSVADVSDLLTSIRYRMQQMASALGQIDPTRVKDQSKLAALMVDAGNLKTRVSKAETSASAAIANTPAVSASIVPAQRYFDDLMRAIKQGYPPDGAQVRRGDLDDVINRVQQMGARVDLSQMPQPRAVDRDRQVLEGIPRIPDIEKPKELEWLEELYRFCKDYEKEILIASLVAGGFLLWHMAPHVIPAAGKATKAFLLA